MNRNLTLISLAVLGLPFFASCATAPPPFGTSYEAYRGFKARTFVGTSEDVRPAVIASLRDQGFEVYPDAEDRTYIIAGLVFANLVEVHTLPFEDAVIMTS